MELNNKQTLRTLREQIENALKDRVVLEELVFELGSCSYDRVQALSIQHKSTKVSLSNEGYQFEWHTDLQDCYIYCKEMVS